MPFDYQMSFRRYGRFYRNAQRYVQRREVLISTNVVLTLFTISFFAVFAIRPTAITISRLWREIQDKQLVQTKLEKKIADLEAGQISLAQVEDDLVLLDAALPSTIEFSRFVRTIEYLSALHGVHLLSNRFSSLEFYASEAHLQVQGLGVNPFSVTLTGTYPQLLEFIADLERLNRIITIISIGIAPSELKEQEAVFRLDLNIDANVYSFIQAAQVNSQESP